MTTYAEDGGKLFRIAGDNTIVSHPCKRSPTIRHLARSLIEVILSRIELGTHDKGVKICLFPFTSKISRRSFLRLSDVFG